MACCTKSEHEEVKHVLTNLITQLCKNGVKYADKLHIEGLVGVTIDHSDVFFVRISETIDKAPRGANNSLDACSVRTSSGRPTPRNVHSHRTPSYDGPPRRTQTSSPSPKRQSPLPPSGPTPRLLVKHNPPPYRGTPSQKIRKTEKPEVVELDADDEDDEQDLKPIIMNLPSGLHSGQGTSSSDTEDTVLGTGTTSEVVPQDLPSNVTVIEPSDCDLDDTHAMRQGYQVHEQDMGQEEEPPLKIMRLDHATPKPNAPVYVGQWPLLAGESNTPSASPSTASFSSGFIPDVSGSTRGFKNPRNNTMCQPVRDVLEHSLARPILAEAHEITAFRLFWRGQDTITGWKNIIYNRMELDAVVADYPGVSFFISAVTATARDPKTTFSNNDARLRAYPALGYWVATRDSCFDRHALMKRLSETADSAELKTMLQCDGEKVNEMGALNLIVKDYGKGYVQQRIRESAGEDHPTIRFILKEDHFEEKLLEAVDLLNGVGCPVSLEKVDIDSSYDADNTDMGDGEAGDGEGENGVVEGEEGRGGEGMAGD